MKKLILILILLTQPLFSQYYQWQIIPGHNMPYPVSGGQVVFDTTSKNNQYFYLLGGRDASNQPVDWIQEYDVINGQWKIAGNLDQPRSEFVADIWGNSIFYFGGVTDTSLLKNNIGAWNFKSYPSEPEIYDTSLIFARRYSTGHIKNDELYIIGGNPVPGIDAEMPYIVGYDLKNKEINFTYGTISANLPEQQMTVLYNKYIYIFGGILHGALNQINRLDLENKEFVKLDNVLQTPRAGGVAIYNSFLKKALIIGGYNESEPALSKVEAVEFLSGGSILISQFASLRIPRRYPMAVNYYGTILVFGGIDPQGNIVPQIEKLVNSPTTLNQDDDVLPYQNTLHQNYPNPFNPETKITFELAKSSYISLDIYSPTGELLINLKKGELNAGRHNLIWSGVDRYGNKVGSGIYLLRLAGEDFQLSRKIVLMK
ncbi:hypothetical protein MROS_1234 [Melioribacter roseus P3M-2]|uniref:Secretion system C-terminal sorting domain-containing protein n=1 Tax=Melioribacter roseus (strain DSM 23840 / JCM 17771 / VKM B-2668 / P3M-2) TaxID=1191523 RepID=I7A3L3_MELRP|nr:T9SS type A sorting domain-containing protein [Melioribacter roseus]AFN74471.1 hypothetical protein MROS_1234 [Melioribacter roseus P3M-2]